MPLWYRRHRSLSTRPLDHTDTSHGAVLEHDLLGIEPEPGTPGAHAVALARPVDQDTCPHEDVTDVVALGQTPSTGMCAGCGTDVVESDEGLWDGS